ncbi:MAG: hypothetical protein AAFN93_06365 [Bacteroidota bacterium]
MFSFQTGEYEELSIEERQQKSKDLWYQEYSKHGFNGDYQGTPKAKELLDKILALDPENCDALRELSVPYLKRGIPHEWKPLFDKAVECDPVVWQPWRGYLYLFFYRDYEKAIADFNASDTLTPDFIDAPQGQSVNYWRGVAYLGKKDYKNSIDFFSRHISIASAELGENWVEPSSFLYKGIAQFRTDTLKEAEDNMLKMLKYNNDRSADAHYYLALIYNQTGELDSAKEHIESSLLDYKAGFYRYRPYVEEIEQIYPEQILSLKSEIEAQHNAHD